MCPHMAMLWSVKGEGPSEATGTIVFLKGWCLHPETSDVPPTHPLNEILRLLHVGRLANNALFKKTWSHVQQEADEVKFTTWLEVFHGVGHRFSRRESIPFRYEAPR